MHCGASVSELYRVFIGSMVVMCILHVCNVDMHDVQYDIYASAVWLEHLALSLSTSLILPAFVQLFLPHVRLSLSFLCAQ